VKHRWDRETLTGILMQKSGGATIASNLPADGCGAQAALNSNCKTVSMDNRVLITQIALQQNDCQPIKIRLSQSVYPVHLQPPQYDYINRIGCKPSNVDFE